MSSFLLPKKRKKPKNENEDISTLQMSSFFLGVFKRRLSAFRQEPGPPQIKMYRRQDRHCDGAKNSCERTISKAEDIATTFSTAQALVSSFHFLRKLLASVSAIRHYRCDFTRNSPVSKDDDIASNRNPQLSRIHRNYKTGQSHELPKYLNTLLL